MAIFVAIPKLGMAMTEATLVDWKVAEGDPVSRGDVVVTIETEKTNWDVEALAPGFLHIVVPVDATVPVGRVVGLIAETAEELATLQREPDRELYTTAPEPVPEGQAPAATDAPRRQAGERRGEIKVSPLAKKLAAEAGIDLGAVEGTGPEGRVVREDVEREIARRQHAGAAAGGPDLRVAMTIPLKGMRRTIAEHMHRSLAVAAQLTYLGEVDMSEVVAYRQDLRERRTDDDPRVTYTDILVVAVARALREHPILNSSLIDDEIRVWDEVNIGVAVALDRGLEGGLIVPVVRDADRKSLAVVSQEVASLVERARAGRLMPDDVSGGTFTLTNLGTVGGGWFFGTPIINQPQSAVLGTGSVTERAVVRDGQVVARPVMPYSLTFDHRVIDGAPAMKFATRLTELLETPGLPWLM